MPTRILNQQGPFSLEASTRFLEGFTPARYRGGSGDPDDPALRLAFPVENTDDVAISKVTQRTDGAVVAEVEGSDPDVVAHQLERILSLDIDGTGFPDVGRRDPLLGMMIDRYHGLRPVCFQSPYEAACWAVIGHRIRMVQAAAIKERIADTYGERLSIDGVELSAFPVPAVLEKIAGELPLPEIKRERLRGLASAALEGDLDADRLRARAPEEALDSLMELAGIGRFSAELILVRGCGAPDVFPSSERRLHATMRALYDAPDAGQRELLELAEPWRPYRSWASVLVRTYGAEPGK